MAKEQDTFQVHIQEIDILAARKIAEAMWASPGNLQSMWVMCRNINAKEPALQKECTLCQSQARIVLQVACKRTETEQPQLSSPATASRHQSKIMVKVPAGINCSDFPATYMNIGQHNRGDPQTSRLTLSRINNGSHLTTGFFAEVSKRA